ncbi:MAG: response regulator transcription factor [Phycisphaerae bacterium]|nr:response regulator transcription factor [Phycisphaerae bacterium]
MKDDPTVFVIDHDEASRRDLQTLLRSVEIPVEIFASAHEFLEAVDPSRPGCLVLDTRLPGMSGLELQQRLADRPVSPPVIIITSHGDIPMAVEATRNGAIDFLEKPFRQQLLLDRVYEALEKDAATRRAYAKQTVLEARAALLTPREREVMAYVVAGLPNKAVAMRMGVTRKAVEAYRARVMRKMEAGSLAELVRIDVILQQGHTVHAGPHARSRGVRPEPRMSAQPTATMEALVATRSPSATRSGVAGRGGWHAPI